MSEGEEGWERVRHAPPQQDYTSSQRLCRGCLFPNVTVPRTTPLVASGTKAQSPHDSRPEISGDRCTCERADEEQDEFPGRERSEIEAMSVQVPKDPDCQQAGSEGEKPPPDNEVPSLHSFFRVHRHYSPA